MGSQILIVFSVFLIAYSNCCCSVFSASIGQECSAQVQKVLPCLNYAQGKADTPTKDCCSSVQDMKDSDPKCLCYVMQQTHNGSEQVKSLGIQEARLLQLPSACQLQNASLSFCPKLLGIPPNSPDAAIFTNTTSPSTSSASTETTPAPSDSHGNMHMPYPPGSLAIAIAMFIYIFTATSTAML